MTTQHPTKISGGTALLLLAMTQFMLILDIAIVNVALPSLQKDLGFSGETLAFVVTTYVLTFGGLLLLGGRMADVFGRKRLFLIGLLAFTLASLLAGLAQSELMMLAARALQGVGGAFVSPAALALLTSIFPEGNERNRALGVWSAVAAGGGAAGLLLGGAITSFASWRWVFLINVPLGLLVFLAASRLLPESRAETSGHIDVAGAITVTLGLVSLVYGLGHIEQVGFDASVIALLVAALVLLTLFVVTELRVREPLIPFSIFRSRSLTGANLALLLLSGVVLGVNYFLTLYFQQVLSFSPFQTGLAFLPITLFSGVASGLAVRFLQRLSAGKLLAIGMLSLALGSFLLSNVSPNGHYFLTVLPGLILVAIGLGFGYTLGTMAATSGIEASQQGLASGILNTSQQLGGAIGLAILATVASAVTNNSGEASMVALTRGFQIAFWLMTGFSLLAALIVWFMVREHKTVQPNDVLTQPSK
jgi:EmrB/QacA subfamily drug resistance transporter